MSGTGSPSPSPLFLTSARIYDPRSTFVTNALSSGLTVFETARIAGTSVKMIDAHHGALVDTARESLLERLEGMGRTSEARLAGTC
jgi:DNA-binding CsgD family transcriptional regulator